MYVANKRFKANYKKVAKELAKFMRDEMMEFVERREKEK